jgi:hypothetical protein
VDSAVAQVIAHGDKLFAQKQTLDSLWQEIADNFYPERAHFTRVGYVGEEFASNLVTSYPILMRRELGNAFSSMLRPTAKSWFAAYVEGADDYYAKAWLERSTAIQRRAMYDRKASMVRATKEGDHDFAAFGQTVLTVELHPDRDALLYRCWHLRDVAWSEGPGGDIECVHRKWKSTPHELARIFGAKALHPQMARKLEREPYCDAPVRHCVVPADQYKRESGQWRTPLVELVVDTDNGHTISERPLRISPYVIPRWTTVSGSQYALSPATMAAMPDARLLQSMTLALLDAGEKAANPPMLGVKDVMRNDIALYAGGITMVDLAYDRKLSEVLQPINVDRHGMPLSLEMTQDIRAMLRQAFYLDKLDLPASDGQMTAYEVSQRVQEYIRNALPLFEPAESQYNYSLCEKTFEILMSVGAFGPPEEIPESLQGREVAFKFESPLMKAQDAERVQIFGQVTAMVAQAAQMDPASRHVVDVKAALRSAVNGSGAPMQWTRPEDMVAAMEAQDAQAAQQQQMLDQAQQVAAVAKEAA